MKSSIFFIIILSLELIACKRYSNQINPQILDCNIDSRPDFKILKFTSPSNEELNSSLEAFYINENNELESISVSQKSCLQIALNETRSILARTVSGRNLAVIFNAAEANRTVPLIDVSTVNPEVLCPNVIHTNKLEADLGSFIKGIDESLSPLVTVVEELDGSGKVSERERAVRNWKFSIADLREGLHKFKFTVINRLKKDSVVEEGDCWLDVDRTVPKPIINYPRNYLVSGQERVFSRVPGQAILIESANDSSLDSIFYCLKKLKDESEIATCEAKDFVPYQGAIISPDFGLWMISFFSTDAAGNSSPISVEKFLIYHQSDIENIETLIKLSESNFSQDLQFSSIAQILLAIKKIDSLSHWEKVGFNNAILQGVAEKIHRVRQSKNIKLQTIGKNIQYVGYLPDASGWVIVSGETNEIYVLDRQTLELRSLGEIDSAIYSLEFSPTGQGFSLMSFSDTWYWVNLKSGAFCELKGRPQVSVNPQTSEEQFILRDDNELKLKIFNTECKVIGEISYPTRKEMLSISASADRSQIAITTEIEKNPIDSVLKHEIFLVNDLEKPIRTTMSRPYLSDTYVDPVFHSNGKWVAFCNADIVTIIDLENSKSELQIKTISRIPPRECRFLDDFTLFVRTARNDFVISLDDGSFILNVDNSFQRTYNDRLQNIYEVSDVDSQINISLTKWFAPVPERYFRLSFKDGDSPKFDFHPNNKLEFVSLTQNGELVIWEPDAKILTQSPNQRSVYYPPILFQDGYLTWIENERRFDKFNGQHELLGSLIQDRTIVSDDFFRVDPTSQYFAVGGKLGKLQIWDLAKGGNPLKYLNFKTTQYFEALEFSQNGKFLFFMDGGNKIVYSVGLKDFSFETLPLDTSDTILVPVGDQNFGLYRTYEDRIEVRVYNVTGKLEFERILLIQKGIKPAFKGQKLAFVDEQGRFSTFHLGTLQIETKDKLGIRDASCVLKPIHTQHLVDCSSGDHILVHQSGVLNRFRTGYKIDSVFEGLDGNWWAGSSNSPQVELRNISGDLLLSLSHPTAKPGRIMATSDFLYVENWKSIDQTLHAIPITLAGGIQRACDWVEDFIKLPGSEYAELVTFCDKYTKKPFTMEK